VQNFFFPLHLLLPEMVEEAGEEVAASLRLPTVQRMDLAARTSFLKSHTWSHSNLADRKSLRLHLQKLHLS
jgi:hypothetical protein